MIGIMQVTTLRARSLLLLAGCLLAGVGCVYRMPIQQGNHLDADSVAQVKPGMTRAQVRYLLGTPMVPGGFVNDRWDYDYYLKLRRLQSPRRAHVVVYFSNDLVEHVDNNIKGSMREPVSDRPVTAPGA
jgi:outer membrane protein assembly factor BamE